MLRQWLQALVLPVFDGRILPVDAAAAQRAGGLHVPESRPTSDPFIAATAMAHGMTVVTRNVSAFKARGSHC
ncbi:MAG: PIN domain-containing protein [Acetobacteraceae bacterium]